MKSAKQVTVCKKVLVPLGLTLIFFLSLFFFISYYYLHQDIGRELLRQQKTVAILFQDLIDLRANLMESAVDQFAGNADLQAAMKADDRQRLFDLARPIYEPLFSKHGITHFYFHHPDGVNFLRVHKPGKYGDLITRYTLNRAAQQGRVASGIELGPLGTFTLRVVVPWVVDGRLIGYIELGEEIDHLIRKLRNIENLDLVVLIRKSLLNRQDWETGMRMMGRNAEWDRFSDMVVVDQTMPTLPKDLRLLLDEKKLRYSREIQVEINGREYFAKLLPLWDAANSVVGDFVLVCDVHEAIRDFQKSILFIAVFSTLLGGTLLISAFFILRRTDRALVVARSGLVQEIENTRQAKDRLEVEVGERKKAESALRKAHVELESRVLERTVELSNKNNLLENILGNIPAQIFWKNSEGNYQGANAAFYEAMGLEESAIIGNVPECSSESCRQVCRVLKEVEAEVLLQREAVLNREVKIYNDHGGERTLLVSVVPLLGNGSYDGTGLLGILQDISERKEVERQMRRTDELSRTVLNSMIDAVAIIDVTNSRIVSANEVFLSDFGLTEEQAVGKLCHTIIPLCPRENGLCPLLQTVAQGAPAKADYTFKPSSGSEERFIEVTTSPLRDETGQVVQVVWVARDITDRKRTEEKIRNLAYFDPLTGIPNRLLFHDRLQQGLAQSRREGQRLGLLYIDLDGFKAVNDSLGHACGDLLLQKVVQRLRPIIRESDTLARLGGDEFCILLNHVKGPEELERVAGKICQQLVDPFDLEGSMMTISCSVGMVIFPEDGEDSDTLLRQADRAMYAAKQGAPPRVCFGNTLR